MVTDYWLKMSNKVSRSCLEINFSLLSFRELDYSKNRESYCSHPGVGVGVGVGVARFRRMYELGSEVCTT